MIIVPTKELGVQTVMLIYKLFGGSVHSGVPGDPTNMFSYSGPRGMKVPSCFLSCVWSLALMSLMLRPSGHMHMQHQADK